MTLFLLICAIILIACVIGSKLSTRFGVPTLLFFIILLPKKSVLPLSFSSCFMVALAQNGKLLDL